MYRKHVGFQGNSHRRSSFTSHITSCALICGLVGAVHDGNADFNKVHVAIAPTGVLPQGPSDSTRLIRTQREHRSIAEAAQNPPVYPQPGPLQATVSVTVAIVPSAVPTYSTAVPVAAGTTYPAAIPNVGSSMLPGPAPMANAALPAAVPSSANSTVPGVSTLVPVVPGVSQQVPPTQNCSNGTALLPGCADHVDTWRFWVATRVAPVLCVFIAMGIAAMQSPAKHKKLQDGPFGWSARALGLVIAWNLLLMSLPKVGYMLAGCLWSSITGLTTVLTLAAACFTPVCDFLEIQSPFGKVGCYKTAIFLVSTGGSGMSFALLFGDAVCAGTFVKLFILCCVDGAVFGWAYYKEENIVASTVNKVSGAVRGK